MLALVAPRRRRRPSLTPMIDVVFLLLVFFMLAARFGLTESVPLSLATGGGPYSGPPRMVTVAPGALTLNGRPLDAADLPGALSELMQSPTDTILLRPANGTDVQRLLDVITLLRDAGLGNLAILEGVP